MPLYYMFDKILILFKQDLKDYSKNTHDKRPSDCKRILPNIYTANLYSQFSNAIK